MHFINAPPPQPAGGTSHVNILKGEHELVGLGEKSCLSTLCGRLCYCEAVGCFTMCGQLRVISSSSFQLKLDTPSSVLKSYLCGKRVSMFTQWAWSQLSIAYFPWSSPLCVPISPAPRWADMKSCPSGCQSFKGIHHKRAHKGSFVQHLQGDASGFQANRDLGVYLHSTSCLPHLADGEVSPLNLWLQRSENDWVAVTFWPSLASIFKGTEKAISAFRIN